MSAKPNLADRHPMPTVAMMLALVLALWSTSASAFQAGETTGPPAGDAVAPAAQAVPEGAAHSVPQATAPVVGRSVAGVPVDRDPTASTEAAAVLDAGSPVCRSDPVSDCIVQRMAPLTTCGSDCARSVREALAPLRGRVEQAASAAPGAARDPGGALARLAFQCLGQGPEGLQADQRACRILYDTVGPPPAAPVVEEDNAKTREDQDGQAARVWAIRPVDWILILLSSLTLVSSSLALSGVRLRLPGRPRPPAPAHEEVNEPMVTPPAAPPEDQPAVNDGTAILTPSGDAVIEPDVDGQRIDAEPPSERPEPADADDPDGPSHGLRALSAALRIAERDHPAILADYELQLVRLATTGAPPRVQRAYALIRAVHSRLDYTTAPSPRDQALMNDALAEVDVTYRLYWDQAAEAHDRTWYDRGPDNPQSGTGWIRKVFAPGLECMGKPVVKARIDVGYGPRT